MENHIAGQFRIVSHDPKPITPSDIPATPSEIRTLNVFGGGADPITAGFNAAAAFFNFLCTPAGQRFANDLLTLDEMFAKQIHELFIKIHDFIEKKA